MKENARENDSNDGLFLLLLLFFQFCYTVIYSPTSISNDCAPRSLFTHMAWVLIGQIASCPSAMDKTSNVRVHGQSRGHHRPDSWRLFDFIYHVYTYIYGNNRIDRCRLQTTAAENNSVSIRAFILGQNERGESKRQQRMTGAVIISSSACSPRVPTSTVAI